MDSGGLCDTAAEKMRKIFVSTELGGGGSATASSIASAKRGLRNFLIHAEILDGPHILERSMDLNMSLSSCFSFATSSGLFESKAELGEYVKNNQLIGCI